MDEALRHVVGLPHSRFGAGGDLAQRVGSLWHHAFAAQPLPPLWLILGSGVLALVVVASPRAWPVARMVVTIVHEGGHALVALATGRRLGSATSAARRRVAIASSRRTCSPVCLCCSVSAMASRVRLSSVGAPPPGGR